MRIVSGIQPSGRLHLGNYLGMMRPAIAAQQGGETFYFIANYHALTTATDPERLRRDTRAAAIDFLACGLDPERGALFLQSDVPAVTELTWLLSVITGMGLLERCHSYKDKLAKGIAATHALFSYPVLMAADILAYRADSVPVGRDQKQHVEVTRDIAMRFNNLFGDVLVVPHPVIRDDVAVVPGIDGQKMSKSYDNHIELFATEKETRARIMRIVTDSTPLDEPKDPEQCNVFNMFRLIADPSQVAEMAEKYRAGGFGYGSAKKQLFEAIWSFLEPFRRRRLELEAAPDFVDDVLRRGAETARTEADAVLTAVRRAMGVD